MKLPYLIPLSLIPTISATTLPFTLTYAFTAHINLLSPQPPIPIPGGVRVIEAIANDTVSGPAVNGTIFPGLALPTVTNNGTVQHPLIELCEVTDDGAGFYISERGVGRPEGQVTWIVSLGVLLVEWWADLCVYSNWKSEGGRSMRV